MEDRPTDTNSVETDPIAPAISSGIDDDAIGKGVGITGCDRRDVVFVSVDDGEDLQRGFLEHVAHRLADFGSFWSKWKVVSLNQVCNQIYI